MKTVSEIKKVLSNRILLLRSLERITSSQKFEDVFTQMSPEEQDSFLNDLLQGEKGKVLALLHKKIDYDEMSLTQLRNIAQKLRIEKYRMYNKGQLIREIKNEALINSNSQNSLVSSFRSPETGAYEVNDRCR